MNRKLIGAFLTLAIVACAPHAWGTTIALDSQTDFGLDAGYPGTVWDITAMGNLDWMVSCYSEKNETQVIATQWNNGVDPYGNTAVLETTPNIYWDPGRGFPLFTWSDGIGGGSATAAVSGICYSMDKVTGVGTHIALPQGDGQLAIWWAYADTPGPATITASLSGGATFTDSMEGARLTILNYHTDAPETLTFQANAATCVFAMAVSTVPEPGTFAMLGFALTGIAACIWRKRK